MKYSFLICFHEGHAELYKDGLPIGHTGPTHFIPHHHTRPDGSVVPVPTDTKLLIEAQEVIEKAMQSAYKEPLTSSAISEQTVPAAT